MIDEKQFWSMIEESWQTVGGKAKPRQKLAEGKLSAAKADELMEDLEEVIPALQKSLGTLSRKDLLAFDRILERKLYDIDREEIHEHTDGSDDGFLYARGFIVAIGQGYYDAVNAQPAVAMMDLECEEMCYLSFHVYSEKYGEMPLSDISRETASNEAGWSQAE